MASTIEKVKTKDSIILLLLFQLVTVFAALLDIPLARQLFGFVFFTTVPGYVILKLMRLNDFSKVETVIFSVGLSIAFLMFGGLLTNEFGLLLGFSQPLTQTPLLIVLNLLVGIGEISVLLINTDTQHWSLENTKLSLPVLIVIILPVLSIVGSALVNVYQSNVVLLVMIALIPVFLAVAVLTTKPLPSRFYPIALVMIAISLLFHSSLISKFLVNFGSDISLEYSLSQNIIGKGMWSSAGDPSLGRFGSMLSITILPTVYVDLLGMSLTSVFKIVYPLIFSLVPLGLYRLWQKGVGNKLAFFAVFLFSAQETFFTEMIGLARQMIAEVFFVLLIILISNIKMQTSKKIALFTIFSAAIIVSHYAMALIFAFFITATFIFFLLTKHPSRNIALSMIMIFLVIMFSWYIYTSGSATFNDIVSYGDYVYNQLGQFLNPASRGETVLIGLGAEAAPSVWNTISRVFAYLTESLIAVGFLGLITKKAKLNMEKEYLILSAIAMLFLGAVIVVPGLAKTLNMTRFYHILLFLLAPMMTVGATVLCRLVPKQKRELSVTLLLLFVLIPYFLFQTSFIYEVTGSQSWSLALSGYRMSPYQLYGKLGYITNAVFFSGQWMHSYFDYRHSRLFADRSSMPLLISYGSIPLGEVPVLNDTTSLNGTLYMGKLNVVYGMVIGEEHIYGLNNLTYLNQLNVIYCDGEATVYQNATKPYSPPPR